ncbi:MAG: type IV secretory system conjugative DNA transfer family protein [Patescibacteria group bacterium]
MIITIAVMIGIIFLIILIYFIFGHFSGQANKNLELEILLLKVPKYTKNDKEQQSKEFVQAQLGQVENLFSALSGLKVQKRFLAKRTDVFSFEIVSMGGFINFYIATPRIYRDFLIQQLQAVYPKIYFEEANDYNIFQAQGYIKVGALSFSNDYSLPIKTYKYFENDPLESITNSLSKLQSEEGAAVQYVFRSAPKKWHARGKQIAKYMYTGMAYKDALAKMGGGGFWGNLSKVFKFFASFLSTTNKDKPNQEKQEQPAMSAMEQERAKSMEEKTAKSGLDVNIRVVVSTPSPDKSELILKDILNSYTQYNIYEFGNSFKANIPSKGDSYIEHFIYRHLLSKNSMLLNSEEMTSVVHLPLATTETPNINWLEAVKSAPPANMPKEGIILGKSIYRGKETLVRIKDADRRRHMYEIGQTGTGKSVFLESMIIQDIQNGKGVCVLDPHGDLAETVLSHVPKERAEDVIFFDPADINRPMGINMLEFETDEQKSFVINEMIAIFDKLYDLKATGGPMFEQYMRNTMLLLMDDKENPATLLEIPKVLADEAYRKQKLAKVKNYLVKDFWEKEAQKAGGDAALANMVPYITSKLTPFISNDTIRPIISQTKSAFNFRKVMDENKIIIINLSKGKIGEMNSSLLGMIAIGKILFAALSRVDIAEENRQDFYLYIDEFQNYITDSIAIILSEARKYKLNLILAHQYLAQLTKGGNTSVRDAVFGNVGTLISYRIGVEDAEVIAKQMAPVVSEYDLVNMPKYTCYVKLLIDNQNPPAFNFNPILPEKGNYELAQAIKELSRLKYGRDKNIVENEIKQRMAIV